MQRIERVKNEEYYNIGEFGLIREGNRVLDLGNFHCLDTDLQEGVGGGVGEVEDIRLQAHLVFSPHLVLNAIKCLVEWNHERNSVKKVAIE